MSTETETRPSRGERLDVARSLIQRAEEITSAEQIGTETTLTLDDAARRLPADRCGNR